MSIFFNNLLSIRFLIKTYCNKAPKIGLRTVSVAVSTDQISQSNQTSENVGSQKKNGQTADQNLTRTNELSDAVGVFVHAFLLNKTM